MASLFFLFSLSSFYFCFLFPLFFLFLSSVSLSSIMTPLFILPLLSFSSLSSSLSPLLPPLFFCLAPLLLLSFSLLFPLSHSIVPLSSVSYISSLSPHTSSLTPFCSLKIFCFSSGIVRVLGVGSGGGGRTHLKECFAASELLKWSISVHEKRKLN